jgi:hypothetical protein
MVRRRRLCVSSAHKHTHISRSLFERGAFIWSWLFCAYVYSGQECKGKKTPDGALLQQHLAVATSSREDKELGIGHTRASAHDI